ncbi:hypothetical protein TK45_06790 [Bowmanella sp. JS7-9]|nr:hypothetical protein TK45_06790 [Bowmanella sp. JS7-9]
MPLVIFWDNLMIRCDRQLIRVFSVKNTIKDVTRYEPIAYKETDSNSENPVNFFYILLLGHPIYRVAALKK